MSHPTSSVALSWNRPLFWQFIGITFGISWICWLLVASTGINPFQNLEVGVLLVLGGFGPAIAGVWTVYRMGNANALRDYWRRITQLRLIQLAWFIPILFLYPGAVMLAFVIQGTPVNTAPLTALLAQPGTLITTLIFVFLFGPFSEELGWRGVALDQLQARFNALTASVILGVIWWAWHLPLLWVPGSFLSTTGNDPVFLMGYLGTVLLYTILFTWVYNHNQRSILAAVLFHFVINLTSRLIAMPAEIFIIVTLILIVVTVGVIVFYGAATFTRSPSLQAEAKHT